MQKERPDSFGESGRRLDYGTYLHITELLALQPRLTSAHDELLFITVHQVYELWFQQLLHEVESARDQLSGGEVVAAAHLLRRVVAIDRLLVQQVEILETMSPVDFLAFRHELAPASGFQSVQFRELEFLSGLRDAAILDRLSCTAEERERLQRRHAEPSLGDAFQSACDALGVVVLADVFRNEKFRGLREVAELMLDHDELFALWRYRHVLMVERQIGTKTGTGGSSGAAYLRSTLDQRFYPELWAVRSEL